MAIENFRVRPVTSALERWLDAQEETPREPAKAHPLDEEDARRLHRKLLGWWYDERDRQAVNRYQQAIDCDFYDGDQWDAEARAEVESRDQAPIVYNEVAPAVDWLIGTERRTRVDWKVLPRTEDDVQGADVKTKVLKYQSDANRIAFNRSQAFADAAKAGVGWVESGVRNDPTKGRIFHSTESWRHVLWDSASHDQGLSDARYVFRWRWVDLDVAEAAWPDRVHVLRAAATGSEEFTEQDDGQWYLGAQVARDGPLPTMDRWTHATTTEGKRRERVKVIECQYRVPVPCQVCAGGPYDRAIYRDTDVMMREAHEAGRLTLVDHVAMVMHVAIMTEDHLLASARSPYRHNDFTLTPIWFYRRNRDRLPYGAIRRVRDIQEDINKRFSKALFEISTNQIVAERGAVDDWDEAREEADNPRGVLVVKPGKRFDLRSNDANADRHVNMAVLQSQKVQNTVGVNNENLGRQTNASSGEAIKARQLQGSVATTEPFDNHRLAVQIDGQKLLSTCEQFMTEPQVIRLVGDRSKVEWLRLNEQQADGSYLNDIAAAMADFIVSEQDFHGTLRQAMFESMMDIAGKVPPEIALRLLVMAYEYSDMPNKDQIAAEIRRIVGDPDPDKEPTPEEQQAAAAQQQQQAQQQAQMAELAMQEAAGKVAQLNAQAAKLMAEAERIRAEGGQDGSQEMAAAVAQVQKEAAAQIDHMTQQLVAAQREARAAQDALAASRADKDAVVEAARIKAAADIQIAEADREGSQALGALQARLDDLAGQIADAAAAATAKADEARRVAETRAQELEAKIKEQARESALAAREAKADDREREPAAAQAVHAAPQVSITLEAGAIQVAGGGDRKIVLTKSADGKTITGESKEGES